VIDWYEVPRSRPGHPAAKKILVARVQKHVTKAGKVKVDIRLTARGRGLLRHARRQRLTVRASFTPHGQAAVTMSRVITLRTG
jgi:hypothetical protein